MPGASKKEDLGHGRLAGDVIDSLPDLIWFKEPVAPLRVNDSFCVPSERPDGHRGAGIIHMDIEPTSNQGRIRRLESEEIVSGEDLLFDEIVKIKDSFRKFKLQVAVFDRDGHVSERSACAGT